MRRRAAAAALLPGLCAALWHPAGAAAPGRVGGVGAGAPRPSPAAAAARASGVTLTPQPTPAPAHIVRAVTPHPTPAPVPPPATLTPAPTLHGCQDLPDALKTDCGFDGITPEQCAQNACCYSEHVPNPTHIPLCYVPAPAECVDVPDASKTDCGFSGITAAQCAQSKCCYTEVVPNPTHIPYCFHPSATPAPPPTPAPAPTPLPPVPAECAGVPNASKADCGFSGITPAQCAQNGCCYVEIVPNPTDIPYCFLKPALTPAPPPLTPSPAATPAPTPQTPPAPAPAAGCASVPNASRTDCGFSGVTPAQCAQRGCCYSEVVPNPGRTPSCFHKHHDATPAPPRPTSAPPEPHTPEPAEPAPGPSHAIGMTVGVSAAVVAAAAAAGVAAKTVVVGARPGAREQDPLIAGDDNATAAEQLARTRCNKLLSRPLVHESPKIDYVAEDSSDHNDHRVTSHMIILDHHTSKEQNACLKERIGRRMGVHADSIKVATFKQLGRQYTHAAYPSEAEVEWKRVIQEEARRHLIDSDDQKCVGVTFLEGDSTFLLQFPSGVAFTLAEKIFIAVKLRREYYARWRGVSITVVDDTYRREMGTTSATNVVDS